MKSFNLTKGKDATIPCLMEIPDGAKEIIIMVHGFGSEKNCATAQMLFRRMPPAGFGVITYDQPGHGPDEARKEPLLIENCLSSLLTADPDAHSQYPEPCNHS